MRLVISVCDTCLDKTAKQNPLNIKADNWFALLRFYRQLAPAVTCLTADEDIYTCECLDCLGLKLKDDNTP